MAFFTLVLVHRNYIGRLSEAVISSSQGSCSLEQDSKQGLSEYKVRIIHTQPQRSEKLFGDLKRIATIILNGNFKWFIRI